jgi:hypothetical protein
VVPAAAPVCIAVLVYVFGSFRLAELLGVKRQVEGVLLMPVCVAGVLYILMRPRLLLNPLVAFAIIKLVTELAWRSNVLYVSEGIAVVATSCVILAAPPRAVRVGACVLVGIAATFAAMAAVQWITLFFFPSLGVYRVIVTDDGHVLNTVAHPIAALGLCTDAAWTLWGHPIGRCYSFLREPSLTLVYFFLPAGVAFYLKGRAPRAAGVALLTFSVIALSGTVWLSMAFGVLWWVLSKLVRLRIRTVFPYLMIALAVVYMYYVSTNGVDRLIGLFTLLSQQVSGILARTHSITDRAIPAVFNLRRAYLSPFGSPVLPDASGPWLIQVAMSAGWFGLIAMLMFLIQTGRRIDARYGGDGNAFAAFLFCGAMTTTVVFSDYQMISYAGLTILAFYYRLSDPLAASPSAARS